MSTLTSARTAKLVVSCAFLYPDGACWHVDLASNRQWLGVDGFEMPEPAGITNDGLSFVPKVPKCGHPNGDGVGFAAGTGKELGEQWLSFTA